MDLGVLQRQIEQWAADTFGPDLSVEGVEPMPGHAGLSFGFRLVRDGAVVEDLVMRMPPKGVRRRGNTDVLRQVPLLQALYRSGVPVPEMRHWSDDERWFEVPFFMVGRLPGTTYAVRDPDRSFVTAGATPSDVFGQAIEALAKVHRLDWRRELAGWQEPRLLAEEIAFWEPIIAKAAEPQWVDEAWATRELLLEHLPSSPPIGLFHGDFQTNNILFDNGRLVAVLDWEISGLGAQLLDLGWLLFMNDPGSWYDNRGLEAVPPFDELVERYVAAGGHPTSVQELAFYRAMSAYRFGVISGLNVMLHRTGKRPDPEWERIALSVSMFFSRACQLLRAA